MEQRAAISKDPIHLRHWVYVAIGERDPKFVRETTFRSLLNPADVVVRPRRRFGSGHAFEDWQSHNGCIGSPLISPLLDVRQIWPSSDI